VLKIIAIGDVHLPFHDADAVALTLKVLDRVKPDQTVQIGDMLDGYHLSRFDHDPDLKQVTLREEARYGRAFIRAVEARTDESVWLEGNHEERLRRKLAQVPELHSTHPTMRELLELDRYIPYQELYRVGNCYFVHDFGPAGVNAIRQTLEAARMNIVFGHTHQLGSVYDGDGRGSRHTGLNVGYLANPDRATYADPRARARWQHGLGYIEVDLVNHECWCFPVPFVNNACNIPGYGRISL
jgi:predicted phosphodiesterase